MKTQQEKPIGIFDSGVGGLNFTKEIKKVLPNENLIYFGDTKHLPYGDKSKEAIIQYCKNNTQFLVDSDCKAILVACNTAVANALEEIKEIASQKNIPIFNVIEPVVDRVSFNFYQNIGVIATRSTIASHIYKKKIKKLNKHIKVSELATPLLVPIIEEGYTNHSLSKVAIETYLSHKKIQDIDAIILGCTHYPLLQKEISAYYGGKVPIIDSPNIVINHLKQELDRLNLINQAKHTPEYKFYVSLLTDNFKKISKKFFSGKIDLVQKEL